MANPLYDALIAPHSGSDRPFLHLSDGATVTYAELVTETARMAHALVAHGVGPGDRVVVQAEKSVNVVILCTAAMQCGAVFLPLNTAYTLDEVAYFIADAKPSLIVCDDVCGLPDPAITMDALVTSAQGHDARFDTVPRGLDDLAALLYTSGTTGRSKGAMLTHGNLLSNAQSLVTTWGITDRDRLIHALPIFHTHGLFVALNTSLLAGTQINFLPKFDLDAIFDALPSGTTMMGVPTFYTRLLKDPRLTQDAVSNMRLFISGSAPLLAETHVAFEARTGHRILERYGMTETGMNTSNPLDGDRRAGTVGPALPDVDVRVVDPERIPLAHGGVGMVEVRGPNVFRGYWEMPEKTREELMADGFFVTGDLGTLSEDGYLTIVGRAKDLIITGGYNVYPKEIEDVLNEVEGVEESAVFGITDADFGEAVVAAIVGTASDDGLRSAVEAQLARFKHPRRYVFLDALPRNAMGKVQKNILRSEHGG